MDFVEKHAGGSFLFSSLLFLKDIFIQERL